MCTVYAVHVHKWCDAMPTHREKNPKSRTTKSKAEIFVIEEIDLHDSDSMPTWSSTHTDELLIFCYFDWNALSIYDRLSRSALRNTNESTFLSCSRHASIFFFFHFIWTHVHITHRTDGVRRNNLVSRLECPKSVHNNFRTWPNMSEPSKTANWSSSGCGSSISIKYLRPVMSWLSYCCCCGARSPASTVERQQIFPINDRMIFHFIFSFSKSENGIYYMIVLWLIIFAFTKSTRIKHTLETVSEIWNA